ncbi:MAG: FixH family protein [Pseudomonadota bacterium]
MHAKTSASKPRELTGRHVLFIALGAFAVILCANMAMVIAATHSFPGLVAKNSYVASQDFNRNTAAMTELGWRPEVTYADGAVIVTVTDAAGAAVRGVDLTAQIGRPSDAASDQALSLSADGDRYVAFAPLEEGVWRVALTWSDPKGQTHQASAKVWVSASTN